MSFLLRSLRGGLNNSDPAIGIPDDQCTVATNVEFNKSMLGERRRGTSGITLSSGLAAKDRVTFLFRHLPTTDETASQLWVLGVTGTQLLPAGLQGHGLERFVTIADTVSLASFDQYRWQAVSLHGKLFIAMNTDQDRLHVYDPAIAPTRTAIGQKATATAPTAADDAGAGTFIQTRYYRVRYTVQVAGVTKLRSEPSSVY
jgi:hypothetical protein